MSSIEESLSEIGGTLDDMLSSLVQSVAKLQKQIKDKPLPELKSFHDSSFNHSYNGMYMN